jgi:uncharacterized protein YdhG (YjbR/CyaY superfamily)
MDAKGAAPARIDEYIAAQAAAVQPILQHIRAIAREEAPDAEETISYRMPAFIQGGARFYFAAFKRHIGVYPPVRGDAALMRSLVRYRGERGNLKFPLAEDIPYDLIRRVVRQRVKETASMARGHGTRRTQ